MLDLKLRQTVREVISDYKNEIEKINENEIRAWLTVARQINYLEAAYELYRLLEQKKGKANNAKHI